MVESVITPSIPMAGVLFYVFSFFVAFVLWRLWGRSNSQQHQRSTSAPFETIKDQYKTYEDLQAALRGAGLEASQLIVGIDFTKSNLWSGKRSFGGHSLHAVFPDYLNPYQSVVQILGRTLEAFDDDKLIPAFGFGDATTTDRAVFPLRPDGPCHGFADVLQCYSRIIPTLQLAGPTDFSPLIREAIKIVRETKSYHILVIVADGQVTNESETEAAIVEASKYPLSIIMIGVGDGPWDQMENYDDRLPQREFDNFQFVDFDQVMRQNDGSELAFATAALQEIPEQFHAIRRLRLFRNC